jgi:ubiquinone/menaquinone biosynthesis C-methylase UbiE
MPHTLQSSAPQDDAEFHESRALPSYAPMLAAYHRAHAAELRAIIAELPLRPGDCVLDVACGDGTYASWMAAHVAPPGAVIGVDVSFDYLRLAQRYAGESSFAACIHLTTGDVERLPFADSRFDLVWCAQSLYDFPDALRALQEMRRVVRRGGLVVVLENDRLHHLLLPWPVELELALRQAELQALAQETLQPRKFYVGRRLRQLFRFAGLQQSCKRTYATNRQAPLDEDERMFLHDYLHRLRQQVHPYLAPSVLRQFDAYIDPDAACSLLNHPDVTVTCVDHVIWGVKP